MEIKVTFPHGESVTVPNVGLGVITAPTPIGDQVPRRPPGTARQVWSYATAIAKWAAAGSPVRAPEEIERVYSTVCVPCPYFVAGERPHCGLCGCSLSSVPDGLKNKIAMATEQCPDDPPRWTAQA